MKRFPKAAAALSVLLLAGCPEPESRPGDARLVVPEVPGASSASVGGSASQNGSLPALIATLDREDRAVAVVNANLAADPQIEQVAAVQRRDDPGAPVRLLVLDPEFPRGRGARLSWEGATLATSARAFSVAVKDLVGDHGTQLVATGTNAEGRFTLDVFRRAAADDLVFVPVCRIIADEITIEEAPRTEAYAAGLKNGASWPIVAWVRDADSGNPMDLVRVRWIWQPSEGRYAAEAPQKVPGDQVGQDQLRQLYADLRPEAFEQFVAGLWTETPATESALIVQFDPVARRIAINDGQTLESFAWRDTVRTLFDRIVAVTENEAVPSMHRTFSIRATGASTVAVSIRGDNEWDARELVLARLAEKGGASDSSAAAAMPPGDWAGAGGLQVRFEDGRALWNDGGGTRTAAWVAFTLGGRQILTVRFLDGDGQTRTWLATMKETRDKAGVSRRLTLSPVSLTAEGWEETAGDAIELAQSEILAKP
jgi:hypothetical protein